MAGWYLLIALLAFMFLMGVRLNFGRLLGTQRKWYTHPDYVMVHGAQYNGLITYYVFFVPVWKRGFHHSTGWYD